MTSASPHRTVFVVDDDASFRTAISRLLRAAGHQVKAFSSASEFVESLPAAGPGCVVADLQMPGLSGLDLQAALAGSDNPLPVLFLTGHGDIPTSVHAMRLGAEDFLTKRAPREALARRRGPRARPRCPRTCGAGAGWRRRAPASTRSPSASARCSQHVLRGQLNKQIAADLGIHERTVKLHRTAITNKVGVQSVAELTQLWMEAFPKGQ